MEDSIYDQFVPMVLGVIQHLKMGDPFAEGTMLGPVITEQSADRILGMVDRARSEGSQLLMGGERLGGDLAEGFYVAPTVFGDVDNSSYIAQNEVFGPVLSVIRFTDEEDALAKANDTEFGLAAYFYSRDVARCWRVGEALEYGMVGVNTGLISNEVAPFGGIKQSGIGREGSKYGIEDYLEIKYLCFDVNG